MGAGTVALDLAQDLFAIETGEAQVEQDQIKFLLPDPGESVFATLHDLRLDPFLLEAQSQNLGHLIIVLDDQNSGGLRRRSHDVMVANSRSLTSLNSDMMHGSSRCNCGQSAS